MRRGLTLFAQAKQELIRIENATFFREYPAADNNAAANPPLFPQLNFSLSAPMLEDQKGPGQQRKHEHWAVIAANDGTTFLEVLRGSHFSIPPNARTYPYLSSTSIAEKDHRLRIPSRAIQYVGFNPGKGKSLGAGIQGAYLSARYESYREETDWSVLQYLRDETELNALETKEVVHEELLQKVIADLKLQKLLHMPVSNLSNGQTRRARIAKALLGKPELLLLDEPFMGLDPPTLVKLSPILRSLAYDESPLLVLALRPQDAIPDWITHLAILGQNHTVPLIGPRADVMFAQHRWRDLYLRSKHSSAHQLAQDTAIKMARLSGPPLQGLGETLTDSGIVTYNAYSEFKEGALQEYFDSQRIARRDRVSGEDLDNLNRKSNTQDGTLEDRWSLMSIPPKQFREAHEQALATGKSAQRAREQEGFHLGPRRTLGVPIIELESVVVKYGDKVVLGQGTPKNGPSSEGLTLAIRRGTRLALLGPNGSGKTTLLSLLTSDHPQSYSLPIKFFGRTRLPEPGRPGLSLWEIQSRIGHSAPEIHAFFPKRLSVRQVLESAWAETFIARPKLSPERDRLVDSFLGWWEPELRQDIALTTTKSNAGPSSTSFPQWGSDILQSVYPPLRNADVIGQKQQGNSPGGRMTNSVEWASDKERHSFGVLPFGSQRLLLLLRAIIKQPDIIILDEAFSGLSVEVREKAMCFLEYGESKFLQADANLETVRPEATPSTSNNLPALRDNHRVDIERVVAFASAGRGLDGTLAAETGSSKAKLLAKAAEISHDAEQGAQSSQAGLSKYCFQGLTDQQALIVVSHVKEEVPTICDQWLRLPGEEEIQEEGRGIETGWVDRGTLGDEWWRIWGSAS